MDQFYLENADLFCRLVGKRIATGKVHFSRHEARGPVEEPIVEQRNPSLTVAARVRPMLQEDVTAGYPCAVYPQSVQSDRPQSVDLYDLYNHPRGRPLLKDFSYRVDTLFDSNTSTETIYSDLIADLVAYGKQGGLGTLFAYGQTGSGKTFTINQLQAIAATSLMDDSKEGIFVIAIDLSGKSAFDLLNARKPVNVLEDSSGNTQWRGATEHQVRSKDQLLNLFNRAASQRQTASTTKNDASSRSHSICRIRISNDSHDGFLYFVDLAGSEAARDIAAHDDQRMRETRDINVSLSALKDCIRSKAELDALSYEERLKGHIPLRRSILTKVLKHVFDLQTVRQGRTVVIACINPNLADIQSSKNTLRYAEMLRVPGKAV